MAHSTDDLIDPNDPMLLIWQKLPKQRHPDGSEYIDYAPVDLPYLYNNGFVDTQTYTLDEWLLAFLDYRQADGNFRLNKDQFLELRKYRYDGIIRTPFDALRVREGKWTEDDLWKLYHLSIKPSSTITDRQFTLMLDGLKKKGLFKDNEYTIDAAFKQRLNTLIIQNPSPLRRLEMRIADEQKGTPKKAAGTQHSQFTVGRTQAEETSKAFSELLTKR